MRINIPGMEMINIDEIIERAPRPKGRRINVTPKKKTKAAVKPKAKPKRKPRRISTPRTFGDINLEDINLPEIGSILPRPPKPPVIEPKGKPPVSKRPRPTLVDTTPKPKAPSIPSSKDVERIIADLGIEIPEVINIPGVGQIQLPTPQSPTTTDPYAAYRNREDDDDEDTPPVDFKQPSEYLSEQEMKNITTPNPSLTEEQLRQLYTSGMMDYDDDYFTDTEGMFGEAGQRYGLGVNQDRIDEIAQEINFSSNQPVDTQPDTITQPVPDYIKNPPPAPPVNPFEGFVPRSIIGPSFDPKDVSAQRQMVADARARMTPGANIQGGGYLTYDNPMLGNKQTQFGGYGQPMPTAPLMNYAGLSSPITYSTPAPDPDKEIIR